VILLVRVLLVNQLIKELKLIINVFVKMDFMMTGNIWNVKNVHINVLLVKTSILVKFVEITDKTLLYVLVFIDILIY
jgi:hypothetical protein